MSEHDELVITIAEDSISMNGRRFVPERTCKVDGVIEIDILGAFKEWEFETSCGHTFIWWDIEPPYYCPGCGAKVVE